MLFGFIPESQVFVEEVAHIQILGDWDSGGGVEFDCRTRLLKAATIQ